MPSETITIASLSEFAGTLENRGVESLIFRGQASAEWDLMPAAFRRDMINAPNPEERLKSERKMLEEFKRQSRPYVVDRPELSNEWEWLALAQHYGLPTRLLDWTENAAAALFFAVESPNGGKASTVWCTTRPAEKKKVSPFKVDGIYLYEPPHILPRITVQQACFTVHPTLYDVEPFVWPGDSFRIDIPSEARIGIRRALRSLGIHRAHLFPDAAAIAADLKRRFGVAKDEA